MAYKNIENLYRPDAQDILLFKECYALEKIHGTSAHIAWKDGKVRFSSGCVSHEKFVALFDEPALTAIFEEMGHDSVTVYGEAFGGKCMRMSATYGKELRFVAFEVRIGDSWLSVPQAENVVQKLGLEFVHYVKIPTTLDAIDIQRNAYSMQAVRNGMGLGKQREGIVLRPLIELRKNNGQRIIAKHKNAEFAERKTPQPVGTAIAEIMREANAVAEEFVVPTRLLHVLDKMPEGIGMESCGDVIKAMTEDVLREASGEIEDSKAVRIAIGRKTAQIFKQQLQWQLSEAE